MTQSPAEHCRDDLASAILAATGDEVFRLDTDARVVSRFSGDQASGPGAGFLDLIRPEDRAGATAALQTARAIGTGAMVVRMADSPDRVRQCHVRPDGAGGFLVVARDITDYTQALENLGLRGRLYKALVDATSEMIWHLDLGGNTVHRFGWEAFTGTPEPTTGLHDWIYSVHPEDQEVATVKIASAVRAKTPFTVEYRLRHVSGTWHWVEDHAVPIVDADGGITNWIGVVRDRQASRAAAEALRASEQRLRVALEATGLGTWDVDLATGELQVSDELRGMLHLGADERVTSESLRALVHNDDHGAFCEPGAVTGECHQGPKDGTFRIVQRDTGATRWIRSLGRVTTDSQGREIRRIGTFQDVTESVETRLALDHALSRSEALISATSVIVWSADAHQNTYRFRGWSDFTGLPSDEGSENERMTAIHPSDQATLARTTSLSLTEPIPRVYEYRLCHRSGVFRWVTERVVPLLDDAGGVTEWVGIIADIHAQKTAEDDIWRAAHIDDLTGLPNRGQFRLRLDDATGGATLAGEGVGLILIDLDHFKEINDGLGHDAGDHVLRITAERLTQLRPSDATICRLGGDEFGFIVPAECCEPVEHLATTILERLRDPIRFGDRELHCTATVGYALFPYHDADPSALLKNADMALYAAKSAGRGRAFAFEPAMRADLNRRVAVLRSARDALLRDAIIPFYQPKVSLRTGEVIGFEALLRWTDEGGNLKSPAAIMEAFEDHDLACRIGAAMQAKIMADLSVWRNAGLAFGQVALNVAGPELMRLGLTDRLMANLAKAGLPPACVEVEVTERVLMEGGNETVTQELLDLQARGVTVALDDFGTGYASLTHLKRHPVSRIKIDRSFVSNLETERDSAVIVQALLAMASNLRLSVVAEGVETTWQRDFLQKHGCDSAQGFLFAKPMAASRVPHFLSTWSTAAVIPPRPARRKA